jgi:hypothetical protein
MTVRRRTRSTTAVLCFVLLSLGTACSSDETPVATVTASPSATSSPPSPTAMRPATSAPALDAATAGWMKSFCTEYVALSAVDPTTAVGETGETPQQKQAKKVAEYEAAATAVNATVAKLTAAPAPGIPNGPAMATTVLDGLKAMSKAFGDAGAGLKAASVTDDASFLAAEEAARSSVAAVDQATQLTVLTALAPALPYLSAVPECAALGS